VPASLMLFLLAPAVDHYMHSLSDDVLGGRPESLAEFGLRDSPAPVLIQVTATASGAAVRPRRGSATSTTSVTAALSSANGDSDGAPASPRHTPQLIRLAARIRARTATRAFINTWPVMDGTGSVEVRDVPAKNAPFIPCRFVCRFPRYDGVCSR
jgi:hypothetical protein